MSRSNFLEVENPAKLLDDELSFFNLNLGMAPPDFKSITPTPGFCVKARTDDQEKVFINVCHSSDIPPPPESFDVNAVLMESEDSLFKFPLSLGEVHYELDKGGTHKCRCYDVVMSSEYYEKVSRSQSLRDFIMTLAVNGLESKYNISIDVGTCVVLNKKYHGTMPPHHIKLKTPASDVGDPLGRSSPEAEEVIMPVKNPVPFSRATTPDPEIVHYELFRNPAIGAPDLVIFQGMTQGVKVRSSVRVSVSKQRLILRNVNGKTILSVDLPFPVVPEQSMSNFWQNRLVVAMPVPKEIR